MQTGICKDSFNLLFDLIVPYGDVVYIRNVHPAVEQHFCHPRLFLQVTRHGPFLRVNAGPIQIFKIVGRA